MIINFDEQFIQASKELKEVKYVKSKDSLETSDYDFAVGLVVRLGTKLDSEFLKNFKSLKFIASVTTGLDHIDLNYY